jgi:hypothetical protein
MAIDVFRNIHKFLRAEIFSFSTDLGRADLSTSEGTRALAERFHGLVGLLERHAVHEDTYFTPLLVHSAPELGQKLLADHRDFDRRLASIDRSFGDLATLGQIVRHQRAQELYLELGDFTSTYLVHMLKEEREGNPALARVASDQELIGLHVALVQSLPEAELVLSMRGIFANTNPEEHFEILVGAQAGPPEEFEGVCKLARSVLPPAQWKALLDRLGRAAA